MPSSGIVQQLRGVVGHALLHLPAAAGLVLDAEGHLLLIRNVDDGRWAVPGGCIEPGESPEVAVKRELNEETGLVVEPLGIVGVFGGPRFRIKYSNGDETSYVSVVLSARRSAARYGRMVTRHQTRVTYRGVKSTTWSWRRLAQSCWPESG